MIIREKKGVLFSSCRVDGPWSWLVHGYPRQLIDLTYLMFSCCTPHSPRTAVWQEMCCRSS